MHEHRRDQKVEASFALIVTSDSRTPETDETGKLAMRLLEEAGHSVKAYTIVENDGEKILATLRGFLGNEAVQAVITSGGTGIGAKDRTVDATSGLFERDLPGFGELFRRLSQDEIGPAAALSRATAGIAGGKPIFCLPGSRGAMRLALESIILPVIGHMIWELKRK
jgi:molybdenum cofactor biosynthesis protein B